MKVEGVTGRRRFEGEQARYPLIMRKATRLAPVPKRGSGGRPTPCPCSQQIDSFRVADQCSHDGALAAQRGVQSRRGHRSAASAGGQQFQCALVDFDIGRHAFAQCQRVAGIATGQNRRADGDLEMFPPFHDAGCLRIREQRTTIQPQCRIGIARVQCGEQIGRVAADRRGQPVDAVGDGRVGGAAQMRDVGLEGAGDDRAVALDRVVQAFGGEAAGFEGEHGGDGSAPPRRCTIHAPAICSVSSM